MSNDTIQRCDVFIIQLIKMEVDDRRAAIFKNDELINDLAELKIDDPLQFDRIIDEIGEEIPRGKVATIKTLKEMVSRKLVEETKKELIGDFEIDLTSLPISNGQIRATPYSYQAILSGAKKFNLVYDEMTSKIYFTKIDWPSQEKTFDLTMIKDGSIEQYHPYSDSLANQTGLKHALNKGPFPLEQNFSQLHDAVDYVAKLNRTDLFQKWMDNNVEWDGNDHNDWAVKYLKAKDEPWSYIWAEIFMLSFVSRCYDPGGMMRTVPVIEGPQKIGKSEFCRLLAPLCWTTTATISDAVNNKVEFDRKTIQSAIVEMPDLGGLTGVKVFDGFKSLVSERIVKDRALYSNNITSHLKRYMIIITTNDGRYLRDPTGATRFLPIRSTVPEGKKIDYEGFIQAYPQILAQAIHKYKVLGMRPNLTEEQELLQVVETDKRDLLQDNWEYEIVTEFLEINNHRELADKYGILTKVIYKYVADNMQTTAYQVSIKHGRALGIAFEKHGYTEKGNRHTTDWPDVIGTNKMWWKPGTFD
jgi:hypothetical protein